MDIQAVVFNLYGTLLYLEHDTRPYVRLFNDLGLNEEEKKGAKRRALTQHPLDLSELAVRLKPAHLLDVEKYEEEVEEEIMTARLYPETEEVVAHVKAVGKRIGMISNVASPYIPPFFEFGLDSVVDHHLFSCIAEMKKPDSEIYLHMATALDITPKNILMVGDSFYCDVEGPQSVGMHALHLDRTGSSPDAIRSLTELSDYL